MHVRVGRRRAFALALGVAGLLMLAGPGAASGHPLGNFTFNHYAALRVAPGEIAIDAVVDLAEIPTFRERLALDTNGDGTVSDAEADAARVDECRAVATSLSLSVDGTAVAPTLTAAGLAFPAGAGGVPTMRIVCELVARVQVGPRDGSTVRFEDRGDAGRLGWHEVVVLGDGTTITGLDGGPPPATADRSARLTSYPADLLTHPLDVRVAAFSVTLGGPRAPAFTAPDAAPLPGPSTGSGSGATPTAASPVPSPGAGAVQTGPAAGGLDASPPAGMPVPGGVGADIPDLFRATTLTLPVVLASIFLAMVLGAGHALTPGHGKTLVAASVVASRGSARHALGLGLAVTMSHTVGVFALAVLVVGAEAALPPDVVVRVVPIIAAVSFVGIGAWMLVGEVRRRSGSRHGPAGGDGLVHRHGGRAHSHDDSAVGALSWRSLVALGVAGGIIPSTSALIILLGTVVMGRAVLGIVLVVAFGLGMAAVLGGVGVGVVIARDRLARLPMAARFGRLSSQVPLVAAVAVVGIGLWLTAQAIAGSATL